MFSKNSSNPTLKENTFRSLANTSEEKMTLGGTINKSIILLLVTIASALYMWNKTMSDELSYGASYPLIIGCIIGTLILAVIITFKKEWAPYLAPVYAVAEGVFLGIISAKYNQMYNGIALQAFILTFGVFVTMLLLYRYRIIKVTARMRMMIIGATAGIGILYLASFALSFFGIQIPLIHGNGMIGIGFSVFVVGLAAFNLMLDFDMIEDGIKYQAPKYMEWYASFALLVTIVWLYIEILRLLSKLNSRN